MSESIRKRQTLVLIPTAQERQQLQIDESLSVRPHIEVCGFGPVAAAACTSRLLHEFDPQHVILAGIAGSFGTLAVGDASQFATVAIDDIGARNADGIIAPSGLGIPQWSRQGESRVASIYERLPLRLVDGLPFDEEILTVCAASGDESDVSRRKATFPNAVAEDMEAFGVAMACAMRPTPLTVIRGISNLAGDRRHDRWEVEAALNAVSRLLNQTLEKLQ